MENINLELYKVFYYVAKYKNLTKAASNLFISQPAVTQSIKKLENEMGLKLFYRTKSGMELTNEGIKLYNVIKLPIEALNGAKKETNNNDAKLIRIGSGSTLIKNVLLTPLVIYKENNPKVNIEIIHAISHNLIKQIDNNLLDIVITYLPCETTENMTVEVLENAIDGFVAKTSVFGNYKYIEMKNIDTLPLVLQTNESLSRKFLNSICNIELKATYELDSYGLILDFVRSGLGVGFVNKKHVRNEIKSGDLFEIKTDMIIPNRRIGLIVNKRTINNIEIAEFISQLKKSSIC